VSGNCSLYNETNGEPILPTPAIGGVGLLADVERMATIGFKRDGETILLIGESKGHLGQSLYLREIEGREEGAAPPVDLAAEKRNGDFVRGLIETGRVDTVHDISDGGFLVALAEMVMAGGVGAGIGAHDIPFLFGEDQGRYLLSASVEEAKRILDEANAAGVPARMVGRTGGSQLGVVGSAPLSLQTLRAAHERWLPEYMSMPEELS
jgi:phosphoribosylformylglycinamidine synthase